MTTLFDQWVGRAPSALDVETRGTNPTHLADRASAVPHVATVLGDGESATYYDAEKRTRAFLRDNGVDVDHYGFLTDTPADNETDALGQPFPTELTAPRADQPGVRRTTGSVTDATDDAAMVWPMIRYAVSHEEQHLLCATATAAPVYVYYTPFQTTPDGTTTRATDTTYRTLVRVDQQVTRSVSKRQRVEGRKPKGEDRDKRNRSKVSETESDAKSNAKKAHCRECKRTRKQDERTKDRPLCTPCANEAFASLSTTIRA